jgi:hypothetical protein
VRQRLLRALARHVKLISWLAVLGWLAWIAGAITSGRPFRPGWLVTLFFIFVATALYGAWVASRQRMQIREGRLPVLPKRKLRQQFVNVEAKDADLVERGFRQFFMACARSNGRYVAMPSKIVDAYWHALILDTKSYADWCDRTLGRFLHHIPAERLGSDAKANDGLRRAWFWACRDEAIDPRKPSRLPLLFALDTKLGVPNGFRYVADCEALRRSGRDEPALHCGGDFSSSSVDGGTDGFGDGGGGGDGGSSGDGCGGGGCGGGD